MATFLLVLAALTCVAAALSFADLVAGHRSTPMLAEEPPAPPPQPAVSVIVAARDEETHIARALRSVLAQEYERFEVIVVDDRSADRTAAILEAMRAGEPRLRVVRVDELPPGWLGKNHALDRGAQMATGELLLFSDADVVWHPTALARAVGYLTRAGADHVAVAPGLVMPTLPLALAVNFFALSLVLFMRPWKARDPRSERHMGVGAFNLVRAAAYARAGTHRRIAMRPDDDIKLGKILKQSGARQHVLVGRDMLTVEWYRSLPEMIRGLRKNSFAALDYSLPRVAAAVVASLAINVWPWIAILVLRGPARALNAVAALLLSAMYAGMARHLRSKPWLAIGYPVAALISLYTLCAAVAGTLRRGGISWRGTHYPLAELRANRV